jgi:hypothetical protein
LLDKTVPTQANLFLRSRTPNVFDKKGKLTYARLGDVPQTEEILNVQELALQT